MHDGPERRKNPMQVFNIYPQMGPEQHAKLDRIERRQVETLRHVHELLILVAEILVDTPPPPDGSASKIDALNARVEALRVKADQAIAGAPDLNDSTQGTPSQG